MPGPLDGVRVIDSGTAGVGPWAATLLAYLGADVIKVESPAGDRHLYQPPLQNGLSTTYTSLNLNKRCATIDLKEQGVQAAVQRLIRQADVIMDNLRPGVIDRLDLGYESARKTNSHIISASSPAWGEEGPMRGIPGLDNPVQMFSGFASLNGVRGGDAEMLRYPHLDFSAACFFASTVVLALLARDRRGCGLRVTASHLGSSVCLLTSRITEYLATGKPPVPQGSAASATAPHQYFRCQDNRYIAVGVETEDQWQRFCKAIQRDDLLEAPRFGSNRKRVSHADDLVSILEQVFASCPTQWWATRLSDQEVPYAFPMDFDQLQYHQQILDNGFLREINPPHQGSMFVGQVPWKFSLTPGVISSDGSPPGRDTKEVLEYGFGQGIPDRPPASSTADQIIGPLAGYTVVDATQGYAGPFCGLLLADAGAEVIKVEPPGGDYSRHFAPETASGDGAAFLALNRNKRSVVLDLENNQDRHSYRALVEKADIVLEDWGHGAADRLSIGYRSLRTKQPTLVYCSITGYGEHGPVRDQPACELTIQAWTGYWKNLGSLGGPLLRVGADIAGLGTGIMAFLGAIAALYYRVRTGRGQQVSTSMLGCMMCMGTAQWAAMSHPDSWEGNYCNNLVRGPVYGYRTKDRPIYFNLNNATEEQFVQMLTELGMLEDAIADPRFANAGREAVGNGKYATEVWSIWEKYFKQYPHQQVINIVNQHGGMAAEMLKVDESLSHPQVETLNLIGQDAVGNKYIRSPWIGPWVPLPIKPAPALDEGRAEVLGTK